MDILDKFKELDRVPEFESNFSDQSVAETAGMDVLQINVGRL